jgi:hypothetical protein
MHFNEAFPATGPCSHVLKMLCLFACVFILFHMAILVTYHCSLEPFYFSRVE